MKASLLAVAVAIACLSTADARIGETLEQCIQRYGEPFAPVKPGEKVGFIKGEFFLLISLYDGKADLIVFAKMGGGVPSAKTPPQPMTDSEISKLLEANSHGVAWTSTESIRPNRSWTTTDHRLMAYYAGNGLVIATSAAMDRIKADAKRSEEKKLEGF